ncbi:EscV/YscV/HrcV family type III secretion system export apparatus protein [Pandoraea anapnoica]|uniref:EscV/YscV/HrcV family type III secretion system export apparatus protein n=1 Tax=Pandoraea anapnoica TaxID=2508301 RepID=A0A5E5AE78_9BURK|nr:type III secretion system export apparatus subunit SctV [Pandoraea anapnoica]VVE71406.1 EscV/YscV/HrcV family type III secretion system export apparatus protein [Pandoraea anapnoica]
MTRVLIWLRAAAGRQDIVLAALLLVTVLMIIIPMPPSVMDLLIALNLGVSLLLLMVALYINEPLDFSAFPSVLLMTTLFRLGLTISTSRLILLHADAGDIVYTFGDFAAGGNIVVGMIVFLIITIVNFIVITKGSERVAEVSARFSLDGMPGKQMSIDGDLRAGTIDAAEARRLRRTVQKESQFYGAMDGAMKFVKGDAIAGLVIIVVNLLGGIGVGVFMRGMSAGDAAAIYAILSIGDGLVSQIPALLISVTAGIIVTRVPGEQRRNLARELTDQLAAQPRSLTLAAVVLVLFGLIPGFPMHYFLLLAALAGGAAWWINRGAKDGVPATEAGAMAGAGGAAAKPERPGAQPLLARVGVTLAESSGGIATLFGRIDALRHKKFEQFGVPMPEVQVTTDATLPGDRLDIQLYHESVMTIDVVPEAALANYDATHPIPALRALEGGAPRETSLPFGGQVLFWLDDAQRTAWLASGGVVIDGADRVAHCISLVIDAHAADFLGVQEARFLMDAMEERYGELVKELQRQLPISRTAEVLQRLVAEGVSIRDLRRVFEALIEWAPKERDQIMLTEYVRLSLRRHITRRFRRGTEHITGWNVGRGIEDVVRAAVRQTATGSYADLNPAQTDAILGAIDGAVDAHDGTPAVLFTAMDVRRFVRKLIERERADLPVLSFQEVADEPNVRVLGTIDVRGAF